MYYIIYRDNLCLKEIGQIKYAKFLVDIIILFLFKVIYHGAANINSNNNLYIHFKFEKCSDCSFFFGV